MEREAIIMPKSPHHAEPQSPAMPIPQLEDQPFADAARELVKAGFLFSNRSGAPYHAHGLKLAEADVLTAIARGKDTDLKCSDIAERTLITKGGITKILDRLEARGLVRRVTSREDRRSRSVQLSAKGVELCRELIPRAARSSRETFQKAFRPQQVKQFSNLLGLLVRSLEAESEKTRLRALEGTHGHRWN
jgi:MarR family 2-MHQ and catechol resistance regulon transcriptional repressor